MKQCRRNLPKKIVEILILCLAISFCYSFPAKADSYNLTLRIESESNLIFSKYNIEIYVNNQKVSTIKNGGTHTGTISVIEGYCVIDFYNEDGHRKYATRTIQISGDTSYKCDLHSYSDEIKILRETCNGTMTAEQKQKAGNYDKAISYKNKQQYEQAIPIFKELGTYADSPDQLALSQANYYAEAEKKIRSHDYVGAKEIFTFLGDYSDSAQRIAAVEAEAIQFKYETALEHMQSQQYEDAISIFQELDGYLDSNEMISQCQLGILDLNYNAALELKENEKYEEAIEIFKTLADYKDSPYQIEQCTNSIKKREYANALSLYEQANEIMRSVNDLPEAPEKIQEIDEAIKEVKYIQALELKKENNFDEAIAAFRALADYKDSASQIDECTLAIKENDYQKAMSLMEAGQYEKAISLFTSLSDYADSNNQIALCQDFLKSNTYKTAIALKEAGNYTDAIESFKAIENYLDSKEQIESCLSSISEITYDKAIAYKKNGEFDSALILFNQISEYQDSADQIKTCQDAINQQKYLQALDMMNNHEYELAIKSFMEIAGYEDSKEQAAECEAKLAAIDRKIEITADNIIVYESKNEKIVPSAKAIKEGAPVNTVFTYETSNKEIAQVTQDGTVTGIKPGVATITVYASDNSDISAQCTVTVVTAVSKIQIATPAVELLTGVEDSSKTIASLSVEVFPDNAYDKSITWSSSNDEVVTVDEKGIVHAKGKGKATITATANGAADKNVKAVCTVNVSLGVSSIEIDETDIKLGLGSTKQIKATVLPKEAANKKLVWISSDETVVSVNNNGSITAKGKGTATVTCSASDGSGTSATLTVNVNVPVKSLKIETKNITLEEGENKAILCAIEPSEATDKSLEWTSSDTSIATVNVQGIVTAKKKGTVSITASTKDGSNKKASINVKIVAPTSIKANFVQNILDKKASNAMYNSTQSRDVAKKGNSGVFSFIKKGRNYDQYYLIDFDGGYVYYFVDSETTCEKVQIQSGDLNKGLKVTYHDGNSVWSYWLHFKYENAPERLVLIDNDNFDWEFEAASLENTLILMKGRKISEY